MSEENHDQIIKSLIEIGGWAKSADDGVKRINSSVDKLTNRVTENEKDILILKDVLPKIYDFMKDSKDEKEEKKDWVGQVWLVAIGAGFAWFFTYIVPVVKAFIH